MDFDRFFSLEIERLKAERRYRVFADLERLAGQFPRALLHRGNETLEVTVWCSNDYLGIGQNPAVMAAMHAAIDHCGTGAGGTRNISGNTHYHVCLEAALAEFHGKEAALLFSSGYVANESTLSTLASRIPGCLIFSDAGNHASMIHGIRNSRAEKHVFRHNDLTHLKSLLASADPQRPKILAFESVYSMDGDIAPLPDLVELGKHYKAFLYLDEVHAVGLYGPSGAGIAEQMGVADEIDLIQGTLAKAFGLMGGYITGTSVLIDFIRSYAPGFIFTSALSPALAAGALASIDLVRQAQPQRDTLLERASRLKCLLRKANIPHLPSSSHIVPVLIGDAGKCKLVTDILLDDYRIYVQPINYPTVPRGTERLRLTPSPLHTDTVMDNLVTALSEIWQMLGLQRAA